MAEISFSASDQSTVGGDMHRVDLAALIGTMPFSFVLQNDLAWRAGDFSTILDIGGTGLAAQVADGSLTEVSAGFVTALAFQGPGYSLTYRNFPALSADQFMTFFNAADWSGLAAYMRSGDDGISGSRNRDILLGGAGNDSLTFGFLGNDVMKGCAGNDTLRASEGHDCLTGGHGADQFVFSGASFDRGEFDRITDFTHGQDQVALGHDGFGRLWQDSRVSPDELALGHHATVASEQLVYTRATGHLFFDWDGTGQMAKVLLAALAPGTQLTAQDFVMVF